MKVPKIIKYIFFKNTNVVSPCPKCGCTATGIIIPVSTITNVTRLKKLHMESGEYIKPRYYSNNSGHQNAFCVHCGYEWCDEDIKSLYPTRKELKEIKKNNHIKYDYNDEYSKTLHDAYMEDLTYDEYLKFLEMLEGDDDSAEDRVERKEKLAKKRFFRNVKTTAKRAGKFVWKNMIVLSTVGVFDDLLPGITRKKDEDLIIKNASDKEEYEENKRDKDNANWYDDSIFDDSSIYSSDSTFDNSTIFSNDDMNNLMVK